MAAVFWPDAVCRVYYSGAGQHELIGEMSGGDNIANAVATGMVPHPELGWSHHTVLNPIITVDGDTAVFDAQFLVYSVRGSARPANGWPAGAVGAQGTITPIESGYYLSTLRCEDGEWRIREHVVKHNMPYVFPES